MSNFQTYKVAVIGAGIVGLATAYQLKMLNPSLEILVFEKESGPVIHQTGHNSGVIHSGIYYKPGSAKAQNCLNGYRLMVNFCEEHQVPFEICGKLLVATSDEEIPYLKTLYERGQQHGLSGLKWLNAEETKVKEPYVNAVQAVLVPQTGIVDYKSVGEKLATLLLLQGIQIHYNHPVIGIQSTNNKIKIQTLHDSFQVDFLINCAGLHSDSITQMSGTAIRHRIIPFKGEYWKLKPSAQYKVKHLIYPVPHPDLPFLGCSLHPNDRWRH